MGAEDTLKPHDNGPKPQSCAKQGKSSELTKEESVALREQIYYPKPAWRWSYCLLLGFGPCEVLSVSPLREVSYQDSACKASVST